MMRQQLDAELLAGPGEGLSRLAYRQDPALGVNVRNTVNGHAGGVLAAGVDIPTVAAWLGHADGGALLMRVYAHHRRAHSVSQAAKVVF